MSEAKKLLRQRYLALRNGLTPEELHERSLAIQKKIIALPEYENAQNIFTYINAGSEVETAFIIEDALARSKTVAVPVMISGTRDMVFVKINGIGHLKPGRFGIREPELDYSLAAASDERTLIITPGVTFCGMYRIGYGGGYYDVYLSKNKYMSAVAPAFELQLAPELPREAHDVRLDVVITETRILEG